MKTKSEQIFEDFLAANGLHFEKIKEDASPRPDYWVSIDGVKPLMMVELKERTEDENFGVVDDPARPDIRSHTLTLGDDVRRYIKKSGKQIQYGSKQGIPSVLLIYNNLDPLQMLGTQDMDFVAAMRGEYTMLVNKQSLQSSEIFNGRNGALHEDKNTSFSAVGRLSDYGGTTTVTLFENAYATVPVPYEQLPPCFDVRRR